MTKGGHKRDHGGDLHAAAETYGGAPEGWPDLSTRINPISYLVSSR